MFANCMHIRRNDAKAETPVIRPPHAKSWLIGKDSDAGRDWGQEEKGTTEDEMARLHHWLDGRESEWILGVGDGQGGLAYCNSWGRKELDKTEWLNWTEEYIMRNTGLEEAQAEIKIARRNINNFRYADNTTLTAESEEELKSLLKTERGEWKSWLKAQHSENKDHGIGTITLWQIDGETVETVSDFIVLDSKITEDGDCSHEIKRRLLLGGKVMTNLDSIFKSRDITLRTKVCLVKAMVFPVVMYGCESWTVKKAECWRIDVFEVWCWRRLLRVPWTARRSNQSILKEISHGIPLEGMMLKLKPQYFGHLMWRVDSLEKTLMLGEIGGRRRRGR